MSEQPFQDDIKTMIGTMNRVTDMTQRDRIIEQEIALESKKLEMKGKLRSLYESQNIEVSDGVLEEAIQKELDARFDPPPPMSGAQAMFASLWIHRTILLVLSTTFLVCALALFVSVHHSIKTRREAELRRQSEVVQSLVREAQTQLNAADQLLKQQTLFKLRTEVLAEQIRTWNANIQPISQKKLLEVRNGGQAVDGTLDEVLNTRKSLENTVARASFQDTPNIADSTKKLSVLLSGVEQKLKTLFLQLTGIANIDIVQRRLEGVLANSPKVAPNVIAAKRAAGYSALNEGNLEQTERIIESLQAANVQTMRDAELVQELNVVIEKLKNTRTSDQAATSALAATLAGCQQALETPGEAKNAISKAELVLHKINEEYEVNIVSRDKTAFKRTYSFNSSGKGKSISYVVVEATDKGGKPVKIPITSAESGRTETVSTWAEEVPDEVWNKISADKRADGIVDDRLFANKKSGNLDLKYEKIQGSTRRITHW